MTAPGGEGDTVPSVDWWGLLSDKDDMAESITDRYGLPAPVEAWCKTIENASWNNREWALGLWHLVVGQILREQRIDIGTYWHDGRFHLLILAPSSTGKTRACDAAMRMLGRVVRPVTNDEYFEVRPIVEATTAALIGGTKMVKGQPTATEGLLAHTDVLRWDEASPVFIKVEARSPYAQNLLAVINQSLNPIGSEGNVIGKELSGVTNVVKPKCSFLLSSATYADIAETTLRTGFFQRFGIMHKVPSVEQRLANRKREKEIIDKKLRPTSETREAIEFLDRMAAQFWLERQPWDFTKVTGMILNKHRRLLEASNEYPGLRRYLGDFVERYTDKLFVLSMHYCAARIVAGEEDKRVITSADVGRAWVVVKTCAAQFWSFLETFEFARKARMQEAREVSIMDRAFDLLAPEGQWVLETQLVEWFVRSKQCGRSTAQRSVAEFLDFGVIERKKDQSAWWVRRVSRTP
jgi:hypothetical protein